MGGRYPHLTDAYRGLTLQSMIARPSPVRLPAGEVQLDADVMVPRDPRGLVIFVHGSGSSRFSSRNRRVAGKLNESGFATLLADLLTAEEEAVDRQTAELRFNIPLLAQRTVNMIDWAPLYAPVARLSIGLFGASTGAAAAIIAAARRPQIKATVSRGGRVDLAENALEQLQTPLLTIVGELDYPLIELHEKVISRLECPHRYEIVPGATHLFEEAGALERVSELAVSWFQRYA